MRCPVQLNPWCALMAAGLIATAAQGQHMIDLATATPIEVPAGLYLDSVITSFPDDARIGTVSKGMGNKRTPAFLVNGVSASVQGLVKNGVPTTGTVHCTMRINALEVDERADGYAEFCFCGLNFELLTLTDSGWYRIFPHAATTKWRGGMDATAKQPASIAAAFAGGMAAYTAAQAKGSIAPVPLVAVPQRGSFEPRDHVHAVLESGAPARGLYPGFNDFLQQHPDTATQFTIKHRSAGDGRLVKLKPAKGEAVADANWGFSDGTYAYVNIGSDYLRLERDGDRFISQYSAAPNAGVVVAVGVMFGAIGAALYASSAQGAIVPLELDMLTGALKPMAHATLETTEETSDHLFLYSKYSDMDTVLQMFVYGGPEAQLTVDGYRVLKIVPRTEDVPVSFRIGDGEPVEINIGTAHIGVDPLVYLVRVRKGKRITIDRVNAEMAASILRKLDPAKEVK